MRTAGRLIQQQCPTIPVDEVGLPFNQLQEFSCQARVKLLHLALDMQQDIQPFPSSQNQLQSSVQASQLCSPACSIDDMPQGSLPKGSCLEGHAWGGHASGGHPLGGHALQVMSKGSHAQRLMLKRSC